MLKTKIRIHSLSISVLFTIFILMSMCITTAHAASTQATTHGYVYELYTMTDPAIVGGADVPFSNNGPEQQLLQFRVQAFIRLTIMST